MVSRKSAKKKAKKERARNAESKPQAEAPAHDGPGASSVPDPDEGREKSYEFIEELIRRKTEERERATAPIYEDEDYGVKYGHYVDSGGNLWYWRRRAWYEMPGLWIVAGVAVSTVLVLWMFF